MLGKTPDNFSSDISSFAQSQTKHYTVALNAIKLLDTWMRTTSSIEDGKTFRVAAGVWNCPRHARQSLQFVCCAEDTRL